MPDSLDRQAEYLKNRLAKRDRHLRKWARREAVECYRVYDRDIPEIPLSIDRYGAYLHVALYERPYEKPEAEEQIWLDRMCESASTSLNVPMDRIVRKIRKRQRGNEQYERASETGREIVVKEGGLSFYVNLSAYLDTGLFLDHRITRSLIRQEAAGRRVLNLFCYTGSFSAYAAAGGAKSVTSVDLSGTYLTWAERNMRLNNLQDASRPFVREDAVAFLATAVARRTRYDTVILDPPTFSNSKRMTEPLDVTQDWPALLENCLSVLEPGGSLWFSTNARKFRFDETLVPGASIQDLTQATTPVDFDVKRPHRCWKLIKTA